MSLFSQKGSHTTGSHAAPAKKPQKPPKKQPEELTEEQPISRSSAFARRLAVNMGFDRKKTAEEKKTAGKKKKLTVLLIVLGSILLLLILAVIFFKIWTEAPEVEDEGLRTQEIATPTPIPSAAATPQATATPEPTEEPVKVVRRDNVYTLLVVGRDRVGMNTDTILVVTMDCDKKEINVVSIPRDTLVNVTWNVKKVNSIYGVTGIQGLVDGVGDLLGYTVDNYMVVNTFVFQQLIDCIGGVDFEVPMYMIYDDPDQDLHIYLEPGYQHLNGYQCEQLVRFRSGYANGDVGRIKTQQAFFSALARQVLSLGTLANLPEMIDIVLSNTDTNLTSGNIAFYAEEFFKMNMDSVSFMTMPYDTVYIRGGSYVSIRLEEWLNMINTSFNPYNVDVQEENTDIITYGDDGFYSTTGNAPGYDQFYDFAAAAG